MADKHRVNLNKTGTGLGLSISKKIVESLGGKITVVSQEGRCTEFKFTIKIANDASKIEESKQNVFCEEEEKEITSQFLDSPFLDQLSDCNENVKCSPRREFFSSIDEANVDNSTVSRCIFDKNNLRIFNNLQKFS